MRTITITALAVLTFGTVSSSAAQQHPVSLRILMTEVEFRQAGLQELSSSELNVLNEWVFRFVSQNATNQIAEQPSSIPTGEATPDVVESQIEGDFEGWEGETVFRLTNGQIWEQTSYAYHYHYAYRPEVLIYKTKGGLYKMKVEDVDETIYVRRVH